VENKTTRLLTRGLLALLARRGLGCLVLSLYHCVLFTLRILVHLAILLPRLGFLLLENDCLGGGLGRASVVLLVVGEFVRLEREMGHFGVMLVVESVDEGVDLSMSSCVWEGQLELLSEHFLPRHGDVVADAGVEGAERFSQVVTQGTIQVTCSGDLFHQMRNHVRYNGSWEKSETRQGRETSGTYRQGT
jgi:hypothetical protein